MAHSKYGDIRRPMTPERRDRIDAIKRAMADATALAELRSSRGVTQVTLAERLGISQGNVAAIERREDATCRRSGSTSRRSAVSWRSAPSSRSSAWCWAMAHGGPAWPG